MIKFGRNFLLRFKIGKKKDKSAGGGLDIEWQEEIIIQYPITVQFNIQRSNFCTFDSCSLQIVNLKESTRAKLYRDMFDTSKYIQIEFYAGYNEDVTMLPLIYSGEVWECYSWKKGEGVDFLTEISCLTGVIGGTYSYSNTSFNAGTQPLEVIKKLCNDIGYPLAGYDEAIVNDIPILRRKTAFSGKSLELLKNFVGYNDGKGKNVIIRNNKIYIVSKYTIIDKQELKLSADSGLLGYPKRRNDFIDVEMLFEPRIQDCGKVELVSSIDTFFNGSWKVVAFTHKGVISGAVNGQCVTSMALFTDGTSFNFTKDVS